MTLNGITFVRKHYLVYPSTPKVTKPVETQNQADPQYQL